MSGDDPVKMTNDDAQILITVAVLALGSWLIWGPTGAGVVLVGFAAIVIFGALMS